MKVKATISYKNSIVSTTHKAEKKLEREINSHAKKILNLAKKEYVPVVTGRLRDSGKVVKHEPIRNGTGGYDKIKAEVTFGGDGVDYAREVHEAPPDWGQGKNKYLFNAVEAHKRIMGEELRSEMAKWQR